MEIGEAVARLTSSRDGTIGRKNAWEPSHIDTLPVDKVCGWYEVGARSCVISAAASANGARMAVGARAVAGAEWGVED
jgi:hypothetical protein